MMKQGRSTEDLLGEGKLPKGVQIEELGTLGEGEAEKTFLIRLPLKRD